MTDEAGWAFQIKFHGATFMYFCYNRNYRIYGRLSSALRALELKPLSPKPWSVIWPANTIWSLMVPT